MENKAYQQPIGTPHDKWKNQWLICLHQWRKPTVDPVKYRSVDIHHSLYRSYSTE